MFCNNCGTLLCNGDKYCKVCGRLTEQYYNSPQRSDYPAVGYPHKTKVKTFPYVLVIILCTGLIIVGGIFAVSAAKGIAEGFSGAIRDSLGNSFTYPRHYYPDIPADPGYVPDNPDDWDLPGGSVFPPSGNGESGEIKADYEKLINSYFSMVSAGDSEGITDLLHPLVSEALDNAGFSQSEYAAEIDGYSNNYGSEVIDHYVYGMYPYENSRYTQLCELLGFTQAQLELYISVEVGVNMYTTDGHPDSYVYGFDLVKVQGEWFIIEIW